MAPSLRALLTLFTLATAAKKPPPKRVALVSFAAPWDYGPYAHQLRELAEHWREPGVPRCCGAFTPSTRLVFMREDGGWSFFDFEAVRATPRRLSTHHVVWIGMSGTVDRIQYGAPKISPLVGYRGAGMSKDPVKKVSKLNRIFVLTQRPFPHVSELQLCESGVDATRRHRDAVDVTVRASTEAGS